MKAWQRLMRWAYPHKYETGPDEDDHARRLLLAQQRQQAAERRVRRLETEVDVLLRGERRHGSRRQG